MHIKAVRRLPLRSQAEEGEHEGRRPWLVGGARKAFIKILVVPLCPPEIMTLCGNVLSYLISMPQAGGLADFTRLNRGTWGAWEVCQVNRHKE